MTAAVRTDETLDVLAGAWRIFQLRAGHRFSTDDLVTAWLGATSAPDARTLLDLGAGIGSVGLMALWGVGHLASGEARPGPPSTLTMVEAQQVSHRLAQRTVDLNGLSERVTLRHCDLRDPQALHPGEQFDLVTGSPPYIPVGRGQISPHPQRAACRMELRGDIFDYCRAAARALAPEGRFAFCHAAGDSRPAPAIAASGLCLLHRRDIVFRRGRPPTIAVFLCAHMGERRDGPPMIVREPDGSWTEEWVALRRRMGAPT